MLAPAVLLGLAAWRAVPAREWRRLWPVVWFLALVVVLALADRWVLGFKSKDLICLQWEWAAEISLSGSGGDPFVSTATGLGKPMLGYPVSGYYYPFAALFLLPDPGLAVHLWVASHVVWGGVWWWLLLARLPATRGGTRHRWWIATALFLVTLNGFVVTRFFGYAGPGYGLAAGYLPTMLYATLELVRGRRSWFPQACLFAGAAAAFFTISPNLAIASALAVVLFGITCVAARPARRRTPALRRLVFPGLAVATLLALVMALSELMPSLRTMRAHAFADVRHVADNYRFAPYERWDFVRTFTGLGYAHYGREPVVHWSLAAVFAALAWKSRRVRWIPLAAATTLLLAAADWAAHGLGVRALEAVVPAFRTVSMAPTVQGLFVWALLGIFVATVRPAALTARWGVVAALAVAASLFAVTLPYREHAGYDLRNEQELFAWTAGLSDDANANAAGNADAPFVACMEPTNDFAFLIPDPVARLRGIRTVNEHKGNLMPGAFFTRTLPGRLGDWGRLHRMGVTHVVSMSDENPRPDLYTPASRHDTRIILARPEAVDSYFADAMGKFTNLEPDWDGQVRVFVRTRPPDGPPPAEDTTNGVVRPTFPSLWPWLLVVLGPLLWFSRGRPPGPQGDRG